MARVEAREGHAMKGDREGCSVPLTSASFAERRGADMGAKTEVRVCSQRRGTVATAESISGNGKMVGKGGLCRQ